MWVVGRARPWSSPGRAAFLVVQDARRPFGHHAPLRGRGAPPPHERRGERKPLGGVKGRPLPLVLLATIATCKTQVFPHFFVCQGMCILFCIHTVIFVSKPTRSFELRVVAVLVLVGFFSVSCINTALAFLLNQTTNDQQRMIDALQAHTGFARLSGFNAHTDFHEV